MRVDGREYLCELRADFQGAELWRGPGDRAAGSLLDDEFEVVLFHGREAWRYVGYLAAVATRQLRG